MNSSKKDNHNFGRAFYTCGGCHGFMWCVLCLSTQQDRERREWLGQHTFFCKYTQTLAGSLYLHTLSPISLGRV